MEHGIVSSEPHGFTLIEILLVLVIMAVMAAMVVPSFFAATGPSLHDQARRLAQALRLAADEAALTGKPVRWVARTHGYVFETPDIEGVWQPMTERPYNEFKLPAGLLISAVDPAHAPKQESSRQAKADEEPPIAHLLLPPQGVMEAAEIMLAEEADMETGAAIRVQPGPGGIRLVQNAQP